MMQPANIPERFYEYCRLFMAAMAEKTSDSLEFIGAGAEFDAKFPRDPDDDCEDEC